MLMTILHSAAAPAADRGAQVVAFYNAVSRDTMHLVDDFYAEDVAFADPVGEIQGRAALRRYYEAMYRNVEEIRFDFTNVVSQGDVVMGEWVMTVRMNKFNGGKPFSVHGMSRLTFDPVTGKVTGHRDTFDMGEMVYERVAILGSIIRWIRKKAGSH